MTDIAPLLLALGSPTVKTRRDAAARLGKSNDPSAVAPLVQALSDTHLAVRQRSGSGTRAGWTMTGRYRASSQHWPIRTLMSGPVQSLRSGN